VIPVLSLVCRMAVISFQIVSSSPILRTLPGSFFGIRTSMLQCSRVGISPVAKAAVTMLTSVVQGAGFSSHVMYHVRKSSVRMPLGPGDLPVRIQRSAVAISSSVGASSGISNLLKPCRGVLVVLYVDRVLGILVRCGQVHWS